MADQNDIREALIALTSEIVSAHVSNNRVAVADLPVLIGGTYDALAGLGAPEAADQEQPVPAVSIRASVKSDFLVCLEDGRKFKSLKRHLRTDHQLTPDEYRERWNLSADYPMVAPEYAERRRALAKQIGLGRTPGQPRGRRKKSV